MKLQKKIYFLVGMILVCSWCILFNIMPVFAEETSLFPVDTWKVDDNKFVVSNIDVGTTVSYMLNIINTDGVVTILDKNGNSISSGELKTGYKVKIKTSNNELIYKVSVIGDLNGSGDLDEDDARKLSGYLLDNSSIKDYEYIYAGDVNSDKKIDINDVVSLVRFVETGEINAIRHININASDVNLYMTETKELIVDIGVVQGVNTKLAWRSSDESVVTVDDGKIVAQGVGEATVTVTSYNGLESSCKVNVLSRDRIHFISNGDAFSTFMENGVFFDGDTRLEGPSPSETIVLESNGRFALIDAGLNNANKDNGDRAKYVINYLNSIGVKKMDFMLITHNHYDHIGGAPYILQNMPVDKVYMKNYYYNGSKLDEDVCNDDVIKEKLDSNQERFCRVIREIAKRNIDFKTVNASSDFNDTLLLGKMNIKLYATKNLFHPDYTECNEQDHNINSILSYITVNGKKILLTGDMEPTVDNKKTTDVNEAEVCLKKFNSNCNGNSITECVVTNNGIENIDLLKLAHHGYSSCDITNTVLEKLQTKYIVIPNWSDKVNYYYKETKVGDEVLSPVKDGYESCRAKYFASYEATSENGNKTAYYVNNKNVIFDFTVSQNCTNTAYYVCMQ